MQPDKKIISTTTVIIAVAVIISLGVALLLVSKSIEDNWQDSSRQTTQENGATVETYADGTYEATGGYISPGGRESVELTLTLSDGVITNASLTPNASSGEGREYQERFAANYKDAVVGKPINEVSLTRVAGSSLTSVGFNDALEQIKKDASVQH